jgi:hypothetical protein
MPLKREGKKLFAHRDNIIIDGRENKRVREPLGARQFADGDHTMALQSPKKRIGIRNRRITEKEHQA